MAQPRISVIVPTRNRRALVLNLLASLRNQRSPDLPFEVIVVDDGSSDGTVSELRALRPPFELYVFEQQSAGPARARNTGAERARGDVLLFIDDDMELRPGALAAHARVHGPSTRYVGLGDIPPTAADGSMLATIVRGWWLEMRPGIGQPGYRYRIRDVLTGHLSIRREHFELLGGFDPDLRCHEDWEFGHRAMRAALELRFVADAVALHHDENALNLRKVIQRKFDEGVADVHLVRRHPSLAGGLPLAWDNAGLRNRILRVLAFHAPALGDTVAGVLQSFMRLYQIANLRFRWRVRIEALLGYWYWRGVASVLDEQGLRDLVESRVESGPPVTVDLAHGIERAARQLDVTRPDSIVLVHGREHVKSIPVMPGCERLAGRHLKPILARLYARELAGAIARSGGAPGILSRAIEQSQADCLSAEAGNASQSTLPHRSARPGLRSAPTHEAPAIHAG